MPDSRGNAEPSIEESAATFNGPARSEAHPREEPDVVAAAMQLEVVLESREVAH